MSTICLALTYFSSLAFVLHIFSVYFQHFSLFYFKCVCVCLKQDIARWFYSFKKSNLSIRCLLTGESYPFTLVVITDLFGHIHTMSLKFLFYNICCSTWRLLLDLSLFFVSYFLYCFINYTFYFYPLLIILISIYTV